MITFELITSIIATITTILCVILSAKQKIIAWPFGIVSAISLILVYISNKMYCNILLQTIFVIQCIIGWINWRQKDDLEISSIKRKKLIKEIFISIGLGLLFSIVTSFFKKELTFAVLLDGTSTFIALLGNRYLTKKIIQAWPLFMTYNIILITLVCIQGLYLIAILNTCLFFISLNGYRIWRSEMKFECNS